MADRAPETKELQREEEEDQREQEGLQEDDAAGEAESAGGGEEGGGASKKAKKKKKKKRAAKHAGPYNAVSTLPEDEFRAYCERVLAETKQANLPPPEQLSAVPATFAQYRFTGSVRPAYVSKRVSVPAHITKPDYADHGQPISEQLADRLGSDITAHSPENIAKIRHACAVGREVLDIAARYMRAGVTGDEIDRIVHQACIERNAYPSSLNYYDFPKSLCVSANDVICHGIPDFRVLQDGDIVNLDVSVYVDGMHADMNETYFIGNVDDDSKRLVKATYLALAAAAAMIKPGTFYRDLGEAITKVANKNGCAVVKRYCGHGVGKLFHDSPRFIPHYAKNKAIGIMRPGHVFTVEPMLNLGSDSGDVLWPDDWTATTRDGKRSAQFEHTFLVTETGCEILTAYPGSSRTQMLWDDALEARLTRPGSKA